MSRIVIDPIQTIGTALEQDRVRKQDGLSRRTALKAGAATAAAVSLGQLPTRAASGGGTLDKERFLVSYTANGFRYRDYVDCQTIGYGPYLQRQLNPSVISDTAWETIENTYPQVLQWDPDQTLAYAGPNGVGNYWPKVRSAQIIRSYLTERQLLETFSAFLSQHKVNTHGGDVALGMPLFYASYLDVMRSNFSGSFRDVMDGVAESSAMLRYLNNNTSCTPDFNENWARELIELFCIGLRFRLQLWPGGDQDYEDDVKAIAKIFTGWTYSNNVPPYMPGDKKFGEFDFDLSCHDPGDKTVSFLKDPSGNSLVFGPSAGDTPEGEGRRLLGILAEHFSTGWLVGERACRVFLMDDPPDSLIQRVGTAYWSAQSDFTALIQTLFDESVLDGPNGWFPNQNPRFLLPAQHFAWTLRSLELGFDLTNPGGGTLHLGKALNAMGNAPGDHPAPDGYPEGSGAWKDALLLRWNHSYHLATNQYFGVDFNGGVLTAFFSGALVDNVAQWADDHLTGGLLTGDEVDLIQYHFCYTTNNGSTYEAALREVIALTFSSPSAQWLCG